MEVMETINLILVIGYIVNKIFNQYKNYLAEMQESSLKREETLVNLEKVKHLKLSND